VGQQWALVAAAVSDNEDQGFRIRRYTAALQLRRAVYHDWLFLEAIPQVVWARDNSFQPSLGFTIGLEMLFGEKYIEPLFDNLSPPADSDSAPAG